MNEILKSARNVLGIVRQRMSAIGVALSFGKDSMATLDLCAEIFPRVEAFYLFRVSGLLTVQKWADAVKERYDVSVRMYPHFDLSRCYRNALLSPHWKGIEKCPRISMAEIEAHFRAGAKVSMIAYGWRRSDSLSRALIMKACGGLCFKSGRVFPLRTWKRADVLEYLEEKKIPKPEGLGRKEQGGLDFHPEAIRFLKENCPEDYRRWLTSFPFSDMQLLPQKEKGAPERGRKEPLEHP